MNTPSDEQDLTAAVPETRPENRQPSSPIPLAQEPAQDLPLATLADLPEKLRLGVARAGWTELMPVQARAIPYLFAHRDMMIQSRTGSGKTGAYLLPILELINPVQPEAQALILVPTRELALQVNHEANVIFEPAGVRCAAVYGGVGYREQLDAFKSGVQILVGTPGRILDHLQRRSLTLEHLKFLIFDEADRMLSMGFYPDMRRVQDYLPRRPINSYMFSATFPAQVIQLASQFLRQPGFLNLSSDHIHVAETEHIFYGVPGMDKDRSLIRIIEVENPTSALIFCNTKVRVNYVTTVLQRFGYDADDLTSDLAQATREKVLERVRQGKLRFLVATDVAARGIDLPELSHVIQYEPPEDPESYIHRAGRTGRAGGSGTAITLVNPIERPGLVRIGKRLGVPFQERSLPSDEDVSQVVTERAIVLLEAALRSRDRLQIERMQRFSLLVKSLSETEEESALLMMLLDDFYQQNFHPAIIPQDAQTRETVRPPRPGGGASGNRKHDRRNRQPR